MCENTLLISSSTNKPIEIANRKHKFSYLIDGVEHVLLDDIKMSGVIDYAAAHEIKDMYGVSKGYMFIFGKKDEKNAA